MVSNPDDGIDSALSYAKDYVSNNPNLVCALTQSQATLQYTNAAKTLFTFDVSPQDAAIACAQHGNNTCSFSVNQP